MATQLILPKIFCSFCREGGADEGSVDDKALRWPLRKLRHANVIHKIQIILELKRKDRWRRLKSHVDFRQEQNV